MQIWRSSCWRGVWKQMGVTPGINKGAPDRLGAQVLQTKIGKVYPVYLSVVSILLDSWAWKILAVGCLELLMVSLVPLSTLSTGGSHQKSLTSTAAVFQTQPPGTRLGSAECVQFCCNDKIVIVTTHGDTKGTFLLTNCYENNKKTIYLVIPYYMSYNMRQRCVLPVVFCVPLYCRPWNLVHHHGTVALDQLAKWPPILFATKTFYRSFLSPNI